jgi:hypothetical protein
MKGLIFLKNQLTKRDKKTDKLQISVSCEYDLADGNKSCLE